MPETLTAYMISAPPREDDPEPREGTRMFAVLAPSASEAQELVRKAMGEGEVPLVLHDDAGARAYLALIKLRPGEPLEFSVNAAARIPR
ncbi:hypothetical protein [Aureimonas populi]|uniref:Uncharacterized protein n=1 Tax=Aureimonas populi TaxID=1701758 RepID=A0ABW5CKF0_9HYPH